MTTFFFKPLRGFISYHLNTAVYQIWQGSFHNFGVNKIYKPDGQQITDTKFFLQFLSPRCPKHVEKKFQHYCNTCLLASIYVWYMYSVWKFRATSARLCTVLTECVPPQDWTPSCTTFGRVSWTSMACSGLFLCRPRWTACSSPGKPHKLVRR